MNNHNVEEKIKKARGLAYYAFRVGQDTLSDVIDFLSTALLH